MNRMRLLHIVAAASLLCSASAMAAPAVGYASGAKPVAGGSDDSMLTKEALDAALIDGIRSVGVELNLSKTSVPAVSVDLFMLYQPNANNLRTVTTAIQLRDDVPYRGKKISVAICGFTSMTWRAGPSEIAHVKGILKDVRDLGAGFAQKCLK